MPDKETSPPLFWTADLISEFLTPKCVVKDMVDRLEQENSGCFDNPDKTFADLYMKSGMYIIECTPAFYEKLRQEYANKLPDIRKDGPYINRKWALKQVGLIS